MGCGEVEPARRRTAAWPWPWPPPRGSAGGGPPLSTLQKTQAAAGVFALKGMAADSQASWSGGVRRTAANGCCASRVDRGMACVRPRVRRAWGGRRARARAAAFKRVSFTMGRGKEAGRIGGAEGAMSKRFCRTAFWGGGWRPIEEVTPIFGEAHANDGVVGQPHAAVNDRHLV